MSSIYVFDPTANDALSKVRGIGRYVQVLQEHFSSEFIFTSRLKNIPTDATFINPFYDPIKQPLTMKRIAQKQVAVIHDLIRLKYPAHFPLGIKGKTNMFLNTFAQNNYDIIITDSKTSKKDVVEILNIAENKVKVVYPTLSKNFLQLKPKPLDPKIKLPDRFCIYVGDTTWNKNVTNIAKAIKHVDIPCIFVGKVFSTIYEIDPQTLMHREQQELKQFIEETKNDSHFYFPGFIKDEELMWLYQQAKVNLLVSRDEGFGFSYFESGYLGTPSVLADTPIFHETAAETALFADSENPEKIAEKIQMLINDSNLRKTLGQQSKKRVLMFSPQKFHDDFMNALL